MKRSRSGVGGMVLVTASNTLNDPNGPFEGFYLDSAVAIKFKDGNGQDVGPINPAPNIVHPIPLLRVYVTGSGDTSAVYGIQGGTA